VGLPAKIKLGADPLGLCLSGILPASGYVTVQCQAFFDESASHDGAPVLCVAGLIFKKSEAIKLGHEWKKVLRWKGLPYFRMVDCAHGNGVFANLSKAERIEVAARMIEIIKRHAVQGIAVTINNMDFVATMADFPTAARIYRTAYAFCVHSVLNGVRVWIYANPKVAKMAYFFEAGHQSATQSARIMDEMFSVPGNREIYRFSSYNFINKTDSYAIQAADLLAWQWYKDKKNQLEGRPRRKDFENLQYLHYLGIHLDHEKILALLTQLPAYAEMGIEAAPVIARSLDRVGRV
jgi:Protein of unknown function (DUF3800)